MPAGSTVRETTFENAVGACPLPNETVKAEFDTKPRKTMSYTVPTLLLRNLHDVFGEIDPVRRRAAVDEIFHEDAVFHEPNGTYRGCIC